LSNIKRFTAPISIVILIIVAAVAPFTILKSNPVISPPILDPNFELRMAGSGTMSLILWRSEYMIAKGDALSLNQVTFDHMTALKFELSKQNKSAASYVSVTQIITGPRLASLFTLNLSVWILRESCNCDSSSIVRNEVFGVTFNDGTHTLTYQLSAIPMETEVKWDAKVVHLQTLNDQWVKVPLNIGKEFETAQWKRPERVTLGVIFGAGSAFSGFRTAYLHNFTWSERSNVQGRDYSNLSASSELKHASIPELISKCQQACSLALVGNWSKDLTTVYGDRAAGCQ